MHEAKCSKDIGVIKMKRNHNFSPPCLLGLTCLNSAIMCYMISGCLQDNLHSMPFSCIDIGKSSSVSRLSRDVCDASYDGVGDMVGGMVEREYPVGAERCESRGCEMVLNENLRGVFSQLIVAHERHTHQMENVH
jgi:hypothetical protein